MSPLLIVCVFLAASSATLVSGQLFDCFSEVLCNTLSLLRTPKNYVPCIREIRLDGRVCYSPSKCYTTLGPVCKNIGQCQPPDPKYNQQCYYPYCCQCKTGFIGEHCQWKLPKDCSVNKCQNGGTCVSNQDGLFCRCPDGGSVKYGGWYCEIANPCVKYPCNVPNGICVEHNRGQKGRTCLDENYEIVDDDI